jgi:hypothetical protein
LKRSNSSYFEAILMSFEGNIVKMTFEKFGVPFAKAAAV